MKRIFTAITSTVTLGFLLSFSAPSQPSTDAATVYNPQCTATAKSTGKQCKNRQWGKCEQVLCYVHCK
ncbi:hypothetical protein [Rufibacter hautae]|uniref:Uncharacterized protein n=1 Tax=Rufibacter hautae TaxID=2595005 RepID=A0A5B6T8Q9_9BACT|nr:hypothetical protein [Rufibacter hautae]KAA3436566.1 hypothetical protein FOA19_19460 [Rufibacter hautae]